MEPDQGVVKVEQLRAWFGRYQRFWALRNRETFGRSFRRGQDSTLPVVRMDFKTSPKSSLPKRFGKKPKNATRLAELSGTTCRIEC